MYSSLEPKIISKKVKHFERILKGKKLTEEQKQKSPELLKEGAIRGLSAILGANTTYKPYLKEVLSIFVEQDSMPKYRVIFVGEG